MKELRTYITEKFKINKDNARKYLDDIDGNIPDELLNKQLPDDKKHRFMKGGKELLWWKFWKYLAINGSMTKEDLLTAFNLKVTSYTTLFTQLSKENIIKSKKRLLSAQPVSTWNL